MRAAVPTTEGYVDVAGVEIGYEISGTGAPTILLMPTWTIINARFWKAQVPYLARHFRVVTFDGPGNGRSDRVLDPASYTSARYVDAAIAVMDATGTDRAVSVSLSAGARWALRALAEQPERFSGSIFIAPALPIGEPAPERAPAFAAFDEPQDEPQGWSKYNRHHWLEQWEDFLGFFFGQCLTEPHSTKQIEDCIGWGLETTPEVVLADHDAPETVDETTVRSWCDEVAVPTLVVHGSDDRVIPVARGRALAELLRGRFVSIVGAGHLPQARDPVLVNTLIAEFVRGIADVAVPTATLTRTRGRARPKRALYLSSPIGLGHAKRDVAVAQALRTHHPDLRIDWLAQHPVTRVLEDAGEEVHPASAWLSNESAHIESESAEHDLHCFQAWRRMDEILVANFMVFQDVVADGDYDLVIGDEAWDVDYFLHENPGLKRYAYAWFTDFVGWLPMPSGGEREAFLTADYNAEMIEHIARYPRIRDRAIFVGDPEDIVPDDFGPGLPSIREWTEQHYDFAGYVTGFDPDQLDRDELRDELGYRPDERVCIVTVGGSGVGSHLLQRVQDAFPEAKRRVPDLRMVVVAGPRIDPASIAAPDGLEVRPYVPELYRHLAVCDLAVVQGGLTTCMELTASGRPFINIPLRNHFEQSRHVPHRLARYGAGTPLTYDEATPDRLATAIADRIGAPVTYRPVATDGAARAAALLADLL